MNDKRRLFPRIAGKPNKGDHFFRDNWLYPCIVILVVSLAFFPIIYSKFHTTKVFSETEFGIHIGLSIQMAQGMTSVPGVDIAHSAFQLLLILIHAVSGISFKLSAFLVTIGSIALMALILYFWVSPILRAKSLTPLAGIAIVVGLNLVAPVSLLAPLDQKFYLGYIGMITYHNPTIILLRPFAVVQFIYAVQCFTDSMFAWKHAFLAGIFSLVTTFIKPSFAICILPAIGVLTIIHLLQKRPINWRMLIIGFALPSIAVLSWQYLLTYQSIDGSKILFYPFGVMKTYSGYLLFKFILSIFFPLAVTLLCHKEAFKDIRMKLAWLGFLLGAFYTYFLAEAGPRLADGNFSWAGEITLLVLFYVSTIFLLERTSVGRLKEIMLKASWTLHIAFGVIYYIYCLTTRTFV